MSDKNGNSSNEIKHLSKAEKLDDVVKLSIQSCFLRI